MGFSRAYSGRFAFAARLIFTVRVILGALSASRLRCRLGTGRCGALGLSDFRRRQFDGRRPSACFVIRLACHAALKAGSLKGRA
jgi:hypothetical protein